MMHRFPTRAAALRSLNDISVDAVKHAKNLITEEDGMFCFDEDTAEQFFNTQPENLENTMTNTINVKTASTKELVEFYNLYVESSIKKFRDRATAERKCQEILDEIAKQDAEEADKHVTETMNPVSVEPKVEEVVPEKTAKTSDREVSATQAETMKTTLKLDRTIVAFDNSSDEMLPLGQWKNAFQMWKANPTWMTSAQQDGLTAKLYKAAKTGEQITIEINERMFRLANV